MTEFYIGQTFENTYPPEAAIWSNENNATIDIIDGVYTIIAIPKPPAPTYADLRKSEYPEISEQLDMIYWDKINGTTVWTDTISAIKEKYPKE